MSQPTSQPLLLSATPTGSADDMRIALTFSTAMLAGSGSIIVTDGALQTVIDRATGLPTTRLAGAGDTHTIALSSLAIEGSQVTLDLPGLLPGHTYSVLMAAGVLASNEHVAFAGIRSTAQLQFSTPALHDTEAPRLLTVGSRGTLLASGGSIELTLTFSEAIQALPAAAFGVPHASIDGLSSSDGITWHANLTAPADAVTAASNQLTLDMAQLRDIAGNAGSGTRALIGYDVDTEGPGAFIALGGTTLDSGGSIAVTITFTESVAALPLSAIGTPGATLAGLHSGDGGRTWSGNLVALAGTVSSGNHVTLDLGQLRDPNGNAGDGILTSGGVYSVHAGAPDTPPPDPNPGPDAAIELDGAELLSGGSLGLVIRFTHPVSQFDAAMIDAPHAIVSDLTHSDDFMVWHAVLGAADSGILDATNTVGIDKSRLVDAAGHAGSGIASSGNYVVDTVVAAWVAPSIGFDDTGISNSDGVTRAIEQYFEGMLVGLATPGQYVALTVDGKTYRVEPGQANDLDLMTWSFYDTEDVFDDGLHTVSVRLEDGNGHASATVTQAITVDTTAPHLVNAPGASVDAGADLVLVFDEPVYWSGRGGTDDGIALIDEATGQGSYLALGAVNFTEGSLRIGPGQHGLLPDTHYALYLHGDVLTDRAGNAPPDALIHFHTAAQEAAGHAAIIGSVPPPTMFY